MRGNYVYQAVNPVKKTLSTVALKLPNFTAEFRGEVTYIHRLKKVSKLCEISGECGEIK